MSEKRGMIVQKDFKRQWEVVEEQILGAVRCVGERGRDILVKERPMTRTRLRLICVAWIYGQVKNPHHSVLSLRDQSALWNGTWLAVDPVNARRFASCELSLPIYPFFAEQEVDAVIATCNSYH